MTPVELRAIKTARLAALERASAEREAQRAREAQERAHAEEQAKAQARLEAKKLFDQQLAVEQARLARLSPEELDRELAGEREAERKPVDYKPRFAKAWSPPPPAPQPTVQLETAETELEPPLTRREIIRRTFEEQLARGLPPERAWRNAVEASAEPDYELEDDSPPPTKPIMGKTLAKRLGLAD